MFAGGLAAANARAQSVDVDRALARTPFDAWAATLIGLQGADTGAFIDLSGAREAHGFVQQASALIPGFPTRTPEGTWWSVTLIVDDDAVKRMRPRGRWLPRKFLPQWLVRPDDTTPLDSLHRALGTDSVILRRGVGGSDVRTWSLRVTFRFAMNVPVVLGTYLRMPGVVGGFISPDDGPQSGASWKLSHQDGRWMLHIREGLGDCTIACPRERDWVIEQTSDGKSVRVLHLGEPRERNEPGSHP